MSYKAPLPLRLFQYAVWATMLFVLAWFFVIPLFFPAPKPPTAEQPPGSGAYLDPLFLMPGNDRGEDPLRDMAGYA